MTDDAPKTRPNNQSVFYERVVDIAPERQAVKYLQLLYPEAHDELTAHEHDKMALNSFVEQWLYESRLQGYDYKKEVSDYNEFVKKSNDSKPPAEKEESIFIRYPELASQLKNTLQIMADLKAAYIGPKTEFSDKTLELERRAMSAAALKVHSFYQKIYANEPAAFETDFKSNALVPAPDGMVPHIKTHFRDHIMSEAFKLMPATLRDMQLETAPDNEGATVKLISSGPSENIIHQPAKTTENRAGKEALPNSIKTLLNDFLEKGAEPGKPTSALERALNAVKTLAGWETSYPNLQLELASQAADKNNKNTSPNTPTRA